MSKIESVRRMVDALVASIVKTCACGPHVTCCVRRFRRPDDARNGRVLMQVPALALDLDHIDDDSLCVSKLPVKC